LLLKSEVYHRGHIMMPLVPQQILLKFFLIYFYELVYRHVMHLTLEVNKLIE